MTPQKILDALGPAWAARLYTVCVCVTFLIHTLSRTVFGALLVAIALYYAQYWFGSSPPWTVGQLAIWLDDLPIEAKSAIATAVITVAGFLIAFRTANNAWKSQSQGELQLTAAADVETFFSEGTSRLIQVQLFVRSLLDAADELTTGLTKRARFKVQYCLREQPMFEEHRRRLVEMNVQSHRLLSKHSSSIYALWGTSPSLKAALSAFDAMVSATWIAAPSHAEDASDVESVFQQTLDVKSCQLFLDAYEKNFVRMSAMEGAARGRLQSPIFGFSMATFTTALQVRKDLVGVLGKLTSEPGELTTATKGSPHREHPERAIGH